MPALDGMRILDMTQYEAGTSCTQALAWMGADVVKVEAPGIGDPGRWVAGGGAYFWNWNANKRSVVINLRKPEGRQVLLDLLPRFDVFVDIERACPRPASLSPRSMVGEFGSCRIRSLLALDAGLSSGPSAMPTSTRSRAVVALSQRRSRSTRVRL